MPQAAEAPGFFLGRENLIEWEALIHFCKSRLLSPQVFYLHGVAG
jgi:hypothetical protein